MDITEATVWKLTLDNAPSSWSCPEYFPNQNNKNVHSDRIAPDRQKAWGLLMYLVLLQTVFPMRMI